MKQRRRAVRKVGAPGQAEVLRGSTESVTEQESNLDRVLGIGTAKAQPAPTSVDGKPAPAGPNDERLKREVPPHW